MKRLTIVLIFVILLAVACDGLSDGSSGDETPTVTREGAVFYAKAQVYEGQGYSFTVPAGWWLDQPGGEYFDLRMDEVVSIHTAAKPGKSKAFFSVATAPLAGGADLEARFNQGYLDLKGSAIEEAESQPFERGNLAGFEITYKRPWGEPWWQFRDVWLEKDGVVYLLSFRAYPTSFADYTETFDTVLDSFQLTP